MVFKLGEAATNLLAALATLTEVCAVPARAYDDPGHFYTTSAVLHHLTRSPLAEYERQTIAFCTWLPDAAHELNAVGVAKDAVARSGWWLGYEPVCRVERLFGGCPTVLPLATGGPMVVVQQLLHGLTGGKSDAVTRVAGSLIVRFVRQVRDEKARGAVDPNLLC